MANDGTLLFDTSIDPKGFSEGVSKLGGLAAKSVAAVGAALGTAAGYAIKVGSEFETSLAKVSTIADTSKVSVSDLSTQILNVSSTMGIAASDIAEATYQAISAGQDTGNAVEFAAKAAKLAAGGFTSSASAVDILTTALNAYGLEADQADHVSDVLLTTQNLGKTSVDELAGSMGRVIPLAAAYGVTVENLSSTLAIMTANGIATAEATTYTKSMLNELGDSGSNVAKVLKSKTGKSFAELNADGKSLGDVLQILYDSVDGDSTAFAGLWSSVEAGTGALSIANSGAEKFNDVLDQMNNSAGATEAAYTTMTQTLQHKLETLQTGAENLGVAFYQSTDEQIGGAVDLAIGYLGRLSDAFGKDGISGIVKEAGNVVADFATELVSAAPSLIGAAMTVIQSFVQGLTTSAPTIAAGAVQIMTTLVGGIVQTLPQLVSLGGQLIASLASALQAQFPAIMQQGIELINQLATGLATGLPQFLAQALPMILSFCENLRANVGQLVDAGINLVMNLADGLIAALPDLLANVPQIVIELAGCINDNGPKILMAGVALIGKLITGLIESIPDILAAMPKIVEAIFSVIEAFNWLALGKNIMELLRNGISAMAGAVKEAGTNIFNALHSALMNLPQTLQAIGRNAISFMSSGVSGMIGTIRGAASNVFSGIIGAIAALPSRLFSMGVSAVQNMASAFRSLDWASIGSNVINGIIGGIGSAVGGLVSAAVNAARSAFKAAKSALGIHSPSKLFADKIGKFIPPGMTVGIEKAMPKAEADVRDSMGDFVAAAQAAVGEAQGSIAIQSGSNPATAAVAHGNEQTINVSGKSEIVLVADGRELARVTAPYMGEQMDFEG